MYDKRLSEFNYKLLNNILCSNLFLEKYKIRLNAKCDHCDQESEDIMYLIYGCHNVDRVWKSLSQIFNFSVLWKHVIVGFYEESNSKTIFLNTINTYISYKIYKFKMSCRIQNLEQRRLNWKNL